MGLRQHSCSAPSRRPSRTLPLLVITGLLVACGGGGVEPVGGGSSGPPGTNAVTLSWAASTSAVSGYRVYYGTAPGTYLQSPGQGVNVGIATTYTVTGLSNATTYYFAATSYDSISESILSNEVSRAFP